MKRIFGAVFAIALITLMMELVLTRAFDVMIRPNMSYMVVTCALFAFGLAGIYMTLRPLDLSTTEGLRSYLFKQSILFAVLTTLVLPITNAIPFDLDRFGDELLLQVIYFALIYLVLVGPFFIAGRMLAVVFSSLPSRIQTLYFFDLAGAAIGCVILIPFLPAIGPGGLLLCSAGGALLAAAALSVQRRWTVLTSVAGLILIALPFVQMPDYFDFEPKWNKRSLREAQRANRVEFTRWDPVSKIDVVDLTEIDPQSGEVVPGTGRKHVAYDGGTQSSHIYAFDGDFAKLRRDLDHELINHFWNRGVLASHYLKRDSGQTVLIIGSAAGQETKAAVLFGAARVEAVEMVGSVVELGKTRYADYNGHLFEHPAVHVQVGEGRSIVRASQDRFDIIQIYSNHTSSSIAAGTGAMQTSYLHTADAYREYFDHLSDNGLLHINHHVYPRVITTAALAWKQQGRGDFRSHVVVFKRDKTDFLPTILIKMQPWTVDELQELKDLMSREFDHVQRTVALVEDPFDPQSSFLSAEFYSGEMSRELLTRIPFRCAPTTDDRPYFSFLRKSLVRLDEDEANFTDASTTGYLNRSMRGRWIAMDVMHLIVTAVVSLVLAVVFILVPLIFSRAGKAEWPRRTASLIYFASLGMGFIIIELVFIQIFMRLVGSPLHTYSTVLFTLLLAASLGSAWSGKLTGLGAQGWRLPFLAIFAVGALLLLTYSPVFHMFLGYALPVRMLVAALLIFPVGLFLGMPFPLGILLLEGQPRGAIAWAWGLNGLFTVVGGLLSVALSLFVGFRVTLIVAFAIYGVAMAMFSRMRRPVPARG